MVDRSEILFMHIIFFLYYNIFLNESLAVVVDYRTNYRYFPHIVDVTDVEQVFPRHNPILRAATC
jgi:hypothetical protein